MASLNVLTREQAGLGAPGAAYRKMMRLRQAADPQTAEHERVIPPQTVAAQMPRTA